MRTLKNVLVTTTVLVLLASASTARAEANITFTFDPSAAGLLGTPFTGDTLNTKNYSVVQITSVTSPTTASFVETGDLLINNLTAGDNTFNPAGNLSVYSLYVDYIGTGIQSATNFNTSSTGVLNTLDYTLYGVAGAPTFTPTAATSTTPGSTVVNTNGNTPVAIANGSLISGGTGITVSGMNISPNASLTETVNQLVPGFFVAPANSVLDLSAAFNNNPLIVTPTGGGSGFLLGGGGGDVSFTATPNPTPVSEPASIALLGAGLAGIGLLRRRAQPV